MLYFLRKGKFPMKKLVWIYRILLGLFLFVMLILLAAKGLGFIGKPLLLWFVGLYPPYSGYLLLGGLLTGSIWVMFSTVINASRSKRKPPEPPPEVFTDTEASAVLQHLAERCGVTLAEGADEFCLAFQNPDYAIWCGNDGDDIIVGLVGSPHHEHFASDREGAQKEIDDICAEKKVQMIFFDAKGAQHWNDLYSAEALDTEIFARFYPLRAPQAWWQRCLRVLFLFFPPFTPRVLSAEIYSYRGTYDRKIFRKR